MFGNQIATGLVLNNTDFDLVLGSSNLSWGSWAQQPMRTIPKKTMQVAFVGQGRSGSPSGTQGSVTYNIANKPGNLTLCFDDPWSGSNSTNGTNSNFPNISVSGSVPSSGSQVTFTYTINSN